MLDSVTKLQMQIKELFLCIGIAFNGKMNRKDDENEVLAVKAVGVTFQTGMQI